MIILGIKYKRYRVKCNRKYCNILAIDLQSAKQEGIEIYGYITEVYRIG